MSWTEKRGNRFSTFAGVFTPSILCEGARRICSHESGEQPWQLLPSLWTETRGKV